jgi:hypothetical protein
MMATPETLVGRATSTRARVRRSTRLTIKHVSHCGNDDIVYRQAPGLGVGGEVTMEIVGQAKQESVIPTELSWPSARWPLRHHVSRET